MKKYNTWQNRVFDFCVFLLLLILGLSCLIPLLHVIALSLSSKTAQLPYISLEVPSHVIGKNTIDCMRSGIVYGTAGMLDGVIDRIREQFSGRTLSVVATGGNAPVIVKYCRNKIVYDKYLLMDGLWAIYQKNK